MIKGWVIQRLAIIRRSSWMGNISSRAYSRERETNYVRKLFVVRILDRKNLYPSFLELHDLQVSESVFSTLNSTEDGQIDEAQLSKLGSITAKIYRIQKLEKLDQNISFLMMKNYLKEQSTKKLKRCCSLTLSSNHHHIWESQLIKFRFGQPVKTKTGRCWKSKPIDAESDPFLTFTFLYRSRSSSWR